MSPLLMATAKFCNRQKDVKPNNAILLGSNLFRLPRKFTEIDHHWAYVIVKVG